MWPISMVISVYKFLISFSDKILCQYRCKVQTLVTQPVLLESGETQAVKGIMTFLNCAIAILALSVAQVSILEMA